MSKTIVQEAKQTEYELTRDAERAIETYLKRSTRRVTVVLLPVLGLVGGILAYGYTE